MPKPKTKDPKQIEEAKPPTLEPWMDQCHWMSPHGRCLLAATRDHYVTNFGKKNEASHWKWCTYHAICLLLHFHGNDFEDFENWVFMLSPGMSWFRKYTAQSIFKLIQGQLTQLEYINPSEDESPGKLLPPHENQRRLRELIASLASGMAIPRTEEVPF